MARGLDKESNTHRVPPRRNPFKQPIVSVSEEEIEERKQEVADELEAGKRAREEKDARRTEAERRVQEEFRQIDTDGWSKEDIERERKRLLEYFLKEIETEDRAQLRDEIIAEKQKKAEPLIQAKLDHLASQGLEDLGEEWRRKVEGYLGLARDEYEISISPVADDYLKEQGQGFVFTVTYSEEASLLRLFRSGGKWDDVPHWIKTEILDKGETEEKIGELIQADFTNTMGGGAVLAQDLASSEEEARAKAEAAIAEKMSSRLEDVKKYHEGILETQARERQQKEERDRAEREEKEAQEAFRFKKQEVESVFSGLTWSDPKTTADSYIDDQIEHLVKKKARDFKREKIGHCDLVTFYEDTYGQAHSVGGAIFYQGELRALIKEDTYGVIKVVPCEVTERGFIENPRVTRSKKATLLEPGKWQQRRREKRKKDPEKNRARAEEAARKYIDDLIRQEALKGVL